MKKKNAFTLVELLAVIVILAIILVIAVPKVMSVIEDSKKATLESTAKMIASAAEKAKVQNTILGKEEEITCDSVAKINKLDYDTCIIEFDDNTAKVTIKGSGKFKGLNICNGSKISSTAIKDDYCPIDGITYFNNLLNQEEKLQNGIVKTNATYTNSNGDEVVVDAGIRYVGSLDDVNNKVYFNCEDTDINGVNYGDDNYDYASSCETWRIIGIFNEEDSKGNFESMIKIINTSSIFNAAWNNATDESINAGKGINQWGESTYEDGTPYEGAKLMQLLNGYYIGKSGSTCNYCKYKELSCTNICDTEENTLASHNMKPLTVIAKNMLEEVKWYTYGHNTDIAENAFLQERGITTQNTGKICSPDDEFEGKKRCTDTVNRTTSWKGLVALMYLSDIRFANGWLDNVEGYPRTITPVTNKKVSYGIWCTDFSNTWGNGDISPGRGSVFTINTVWPTVYLKHNIQVIGGNGRDEPFKLAIYKN